MHIIKFKYAVKVLLIGLLTLNGTYAIDCTQCFADTVTEIVTTKEDGSVCFTLYEDGTLLFTPINEEYRWCSIPDMVMYLEGGEYEDAFQTEYVLYQEWNSGTNLIIEDGITEIGDFAFHHMNIEQAEFSDDVISVGTGAFMQGRMTFLDETVYPQNVGYIPERGFYECKNLTTAHIPTQIKRIGTKAFQNCTALETVTFPEGLLWINERAFEGCTALTAAEIPDSVTQIGTYAFRNCTALTGEINLSSVEVIGSDAFKNCKSITAIDFGNHLNAIPNRCFYECKALENLVIPDAITTIGMSAFSGCSGLKEVTLSSGVQEIGSSSFYNCTSLEKLVVLNPEMVFPAQNCLGTVISDILVIYGYAGSTAEAYAEEKNIPFVALEEPQTGDVNMNGQIGVTDAVMLQKYLLGLQDFTKQKSLLADMDEDGTLSGFDLAILKRRILTD